MSGVLHYAADAGRPLCWTNTARPRLTDNADAVWCLNCRKRMRWLAAEREEAEAEARLADRNRAAAEAVGIAHVLDFLEADDAPTSSMLAGIIGTVAVYLQETGMTALSPAPVVAAAGGAR